MSRYSSRLVSLWRFCVIALVVKTASKGLNARIFSFFFRKRLFPSHCQFRSFSDGNYCDGFVNAPRFRSGLIIWLSTLVAVGHQPHLLGEPVLQ